MYKEREGDLRMDSFLKLSGTGDFLLSDVFLATQKEYMSTV